MMGSGRGKDVISDLFNLVDLVGDNDKYKKRLVELNVATKEYKDQRVSIEKLEAEFKEYEAKANKQLKDETAKFEGRQQQLNQQANTIVRDRKELTDAQNALAASKAAFELAVKEDNEKRAAADKAADAKIKKIQAEAQADRQQAASILQQALDEAQKVTQNANKVKEAVVERELAIAAREQALTASEIEYKKRIDALTKHLSGLKEA